MYNAMPQFSGFIKLFPHTLGEHPAAQFLIFCDSTPKIILCVFEKALRYMWPVLCAHNAFGYSCNDNLNGCRDSSYRIRVIPTFHKINGVEQLEFAGGRSLGQFCR